MSGLPRNYAGEGEMMAAERASRAMYRVIDTVEDKGDVAGNTYMNVRTDAWDYFGHGWSLDQCEIAGKAVVDYLAERWDDTSEGTLIRASRLAVQEPPLLGSRLLGYMQGAEQALELLRSKA